MTDKKLTPRVGDRVLVNSPDFRSITHVGNVEGMSRPGWVSVAVDGQAANWLVPITTLTVVDRDPVEWPEGWEPSVMGDGYAAYQFADRSVFSLTRDEIERIVATGPDMLARWDELMEEDA